jgi:hypothetical protein
MKHGTTAPRRDEERKPEVELFAKKLIEHTQTEEQVMYPAAILVSEYAKQTPRGGLTRITTPIPRSGHNHRSSAIGLPMLNLRAHPYGNPRAPGKPGRFKDEC